MKEFISKGGGTIWFDITTIVVEDLGAMTHWHTIQIMNWSPAEAQSKFAKDDVTFIRYRRPQKKQVHESRRHGIAAAPPGPGIVVSPTIPTGEQNVL